MAAVEPERLPEVVRQLDERLGREQGREEGRLTQTGQILLELGGEKFGTPDETVVQTVDSIDDLDTLQRLIRRILTGTSWQDLLATVDDR